MNKKLVQGLSPEEKKEFEEILKYNEVFASLRKVLEGEVQSCRSDRRSLKSLLQQNYSEHQADRNATERTLLKVLNIINP